MSFGTPELFTIVVLALLLFGPDRLPELMRTLGKGMRQLRRVSAEFQRQLDLNLGDEESVKRPSSSPAVPLDQQNWNDEKSPEEKRKKPDA